MGQDLGRSISEAAAAVRFVDATGSGAADISVTALTALVCPGDTEAAAMQAAADLTREITPRMRIISTAWAMTPGPVDGAWPWGLTMTVSSRDPRGVARPGCGEHAGRDRAAGEGQLMDRQAMDLETYGEQAVNGPCFICRMLAGDPDYAHEVVYQDTDHVAFLDR
jgi:hypothetical protein